VTAKAHGGNYPRYGTHDLDGAVLSQYDSVINMPNVDLSFSRHVASLDEPFFHASPAVFITAQVMAKIVSIVIRSRERERNEVAQP
jgi:hypothetical protein